LPGTEQILPFGEVTEAESVDQIGTEQVGVLGREREVLDIVILDVVLGDCAARSRPRVEVENCLRLRDDSAKALSRYSSAKNCPDTVKWIELWSL
jgi:hypothetical protein